MIGLDVMGGDFSPAIPVQAALKTIQKYKIPILLIGDRPAIEEQLKKQSYQGNLLDIFHTEDSVFMGDSAIQALRKKQSSLYRAFELHKENKIQGVSWEFWCFFGYKSVLKSKSYAPYNGQTGLIGYAGILVLFLKAR